MSKSGLLPIEQVVQGQLEACFPGVDSLSFVIGVSGGSDSMALMHILHRLDIELHVVHVNYHKRGIDSDKDAKLVEQAAGDLGLDCDIAAVLTDDSSGQNFQQWARNVRYKLFEEKAGQAGASGIATAHHRDDQIETILQKIFRGAGLASWSGMDVWDGQLFRPLLGVGKDDITTYCREQSIEYRVDSSNLTSNYARNFLRNEWLAELEQHFPGWQKNVLRIKEQAEIFENALSYILDDILDERNRIKRSEFLRLEKKLQKSVLIYYLHRQHSRLKISRAAMKELDNLEALQTGKSLRLSEQLSLIRDRNTLVIKEPDQPKSFHCTIRKADVTRSEVIARGFRFEIKLYQHLDFEKHLYLDRDTLAWPLECRTWQKGDKFQPFGMKGHQSVADHLTNRKISAAVKTDALVLEGADETIYAVLFPVKENIAPPGTIAEEVRCSTSTKYCLTINSSAST